MQMIALSMIRWFRSFMTAHDYFGLAILQKPSFLVVVWSNTISWCASLNCFLKVVCVYVSNLHHSLYDYVISPVLCSRVYVMEIYFSFG